MQFSVRPSTVSDGLYISLSSEPHEHSYSDTAYVSLENLTKPERIKEIEKTQLVMKKRYEHCSQFAFDFPGKTDNVKARITRRIRLIAFWGLILNFIAASAISIFTDGFDKKEEVQYVVTSSPGSGRQAEMHVSEKYGFALRWLLPDKEVVYFQTSDGRWFRESDGLPANRFMVPKPTQPHDETADNRPRNQRLD